MPKKNIHITHRKNGDWAVIGEGDTRASSLHPTQSEAIRAGKPLAEQNRSELVIHDRSNLIRDKDSFGNDPASPNDRRH